RPAARTSPVQATRRRMGGGTAPTMKRVWRNAVRRRGAMDVPRQGRRESPIAMAIGATEDAASGRPARPGGTTCIPPTPLQVGLAALAALLVVAAAGAAAPSSPVLGGCTVFPASSPWNQRVDTLPVAQDSAALIASIGLDSHVHADFGSGLWDGSRIG